MARNRKHSTVECNRNNTYGETMKLLLKLILFLILICPIAQPLRAEIDVKEAVVKIYTVYIAQDYNEPWKTSFQDSISGSG